MLKKGFVIAIVLLFIGLNVIASANIVISHNKKNHNILINEDELDQYQEEMDTYGIIGREPGPYPKYYMAAQGFIPTKNILTRVELLLSKNVYTTYNIKLAIRDNLSGQDLISISKSPDYIPTEDFDWIEFDFENILVNPGKTYFIVCSTYDSSDNWYAWGVKLENAYPNGTVGWSEDGEEWYIHPEADAAFKTYGYNNQPPEAPTIDGPSSGNPETSYNYTFNAVDLDGDNVTICIDFGDDTGSVCYGPIQSGEDLIVAHSWDEKDTYIITAYATDTNGVEGPEGTLEVSIPKNKALNFNYNLFSWLFEQFPNAFPVLRHMLGQ